jgi:HK97 family phage prohead protease
MEPFQFYIDLQKAMNNENELVGIASALSLDRDGEKMSERALKMMVNDIKSIGVNLFGNHEHNWENTLGFVKDAELVDGHVNVAIKLDNPATNQKVPMLLNKLKTGIRLGLSVGGSVTNEKWETDKIANKRVRVIDGVKLYEISVVGIPSNADAYISIPSAISKSAKGLNIIKSCPICYHSLLENECKLCLWKKE